MNENPKPHISITIRIFRIYQVVNLLIFTVFFLSVSIAGIQEGNTTIWDSVVMFLICLAGATVNHLIINFSIKNLKNGNPLAYIISIFISLQLLIFIIGFFSMFELLQKRNRDIFLPFFK